MVTLVTGVCEFRICLASHQNNKLFVKFALLPWKFEISTDSRHKLKNQLLQKLTSLQEGSITLLKYIRKTFIPKGQVLIIQRLFNCLREHLQILYPVVHLVPLSSIFLFVINVHLYRHY